MDQPGDKRLLQAMELLYFGYRAFTAGPDRILQDKGLGRVHHRILYFVGRNPGLNINELLSILDVSKQALNAPLRKLIGLGLIDVRTGTHDVRHHRKVRLTGNHDDGDVDFSVANSLQQVDAVLAAQIDVNHRYI